jgi:hypothetical protein
MDFSSALNHFLTPKRIPTLGGHSSFEVHTSNGVLVIENTGGTTRSINRQYWEQVKMRRNSLGHEKDMTSMYTAPAWDLPRPTDLIFAPYVAGVMRYLETQGRR